MIASVNNNITALTALNKRLGVTADNIANVNTDGFKKSRASFSEGPSGDVRVTINQVDTPGPPNPDVDVDPLAATELSNVDLTEEIPQMIPTQRSYDANLRAIKTQDEMIGTLVDILG
jgi:flagellar basal-body rod protein FlgC